MTMAGMPKTIEAPRQPTAAMSGSAEEGHDDGPDVAAGDVGADREAAPLRRELLGEQAVADRVLRRAADPRQDVRRPRTSRSSAANAWAAKPPPNRRPPAPSRVRRETIRVSAA